MDLYRKRFNAGNAEGLDAIVQFNITGEGGGQHYMTIQNQELTIVEGEHADPSITVTATFQDWLDMNLGKINPVVAMMSRKIRISGSLQLAMKLKSLFFNKD